MVARLSRKLPHLPLRVKTFIPFFSRSYTQSLTCFLKEARERKTSKSITRRAGEIMAANLMALTDIIEFCCAFLDYFFQRKFNRLQKSRKRTSCKLNRWQ